METLEGTELCVPQLNSSCRKPTHSRSSVMLIYVLLSSISLITVALNLLVIISISHFSILGVSPCWVDGCILKFSSLHRQLHTPTNLLLLSLAVSDLLVGLLLMPVEIIYIEACWFLGDILCTLYYIIDYIITSASVANMVLIALDRYVAICDPLLYPTKVTKSTAQVCVSLCWICSVFYRLLLLHDHLVKPGASVSCFGECVVVISNVAGTIDMIFTFIMPITVIICLYSKVFVVALSQARMLRSQITAAAAKPGLVGVRRNEMKAARTLGIVVVVFLICFCPYFFPALEGTDTAVNASSAAFEIWLAHFNSCLNPVIYAFFYPWFRKSIKLIVSLQILKPGSSDIKIMKH